MFAEAALLLIALAVSLALRPWRLMPGGQRLGPLLAVLVLLPWVWALPTLHHMPLQLQWSGACLVLLMLGWPLAVPTLLAVGLLAALLSPTLDGAGALDLALKLAIWPVKTQYWHSRTNYLDCSNKTWPL